METNVLEENHKNPYYYKDQLTGLHNRFALLSYLKSQTRINLFLINLDNFSNINNLYGFTVGDEILIEVSQYLLKLQTDDTELFRFDGNEFAFVVKRFLNTREIQEFCESLISFFNNIEIELVHDDIVVKTSLSIGVSIGNGVITLNHAKAAINELRRHSKSAYKIFNSQSEYALKQKENIYWIDKIKHAIHDEKLVPYFQPIVNNVTQKIEKYECLARIEDEEIIVSPQRFMEAAKTTGSLSLVTKTIISKACYAFQDNNYDFSINITGSDIYLGYLEKYLLINTKKYNINPSRISLEILEDIIIVSDSILLSRIESLRKKGFQIAIDDFGQENSNFSRLLDLNPDYLKIDGAFIKNILEDKQSEIIVEALIAICKKSGIKTIAEYIHNEQVYKKIVSLGIDYSQGFYIGAPQDSID